MAATAVGDIWRGIQDAVRIHDNETLEVIKRITQQCYYRLCELVDWQPLRRTVSVVYDGGATGTLLPADLIGILAVVDDDELPVMGPVKNQQMPYQNTSQDTYRLMEASVDPLVVAKGIGVEQDSATISGVDLTSYVNEYLRIADYPGFYKITAATTISPVWRGPRLQSKEYVVRPPTCKRMGFVDYTGTNAAGTYTVYYWAYPEPLFQEWQQPLLPTSRALELLSIISFLGFHEKQEKAADNYRAEYRLAYDEMRAMNPKFHMPQPPQSPGNTALKFGWRT